MKWKVVGLPVTEHHTIEIESIAARLPGVYYRCHADSSWTMIALTAGIFDITGYQPDALLNNRDLEFAALIHPEDRVFCDQAVQDALAAQEPFNLQYRLLRKDGAEVLCWEQGGGVYTEQGELLYLEGYLTDISAQRRNEDHLADLVSQQQRALAISRRLLEQYKDAVDHCAIVSRADANGVITYVNEQFCRISGYRQDELIGSTHALVRHPETPSAVFADMWRTIRSGQVWKGVIRNLSKYGHDYYVNSTIVPLLDEQGQVSAFMSVRHDVTELVEKETRLRRQVTDSLTGLPNRQKLLEDIGAVQCCSLAIVNVIDFSEVNEFFGYQKGDRLLRKLAVLLDSLLQEGMQLYRLAGDEFAILQYRTSTTAEFSDFCHQVIRQVERQSIQVDQQEFSISVAVGAARGENAFIEADIALHSARDSQRSFAMYDGESRLKEKIESNIRWVKRIRDAIREDRIQVFAQPILEAGSGRVAKYECLMRLEEGGKVYTPYFFLEAAMRARLYTSLTRIIIRKAFAFFADRSDVFSINLNARDIQDEETATLLLNQAEQTGVADRLVLELVESEGIENFDQVSQFLARAKAIGCRIAIDDFGTGYSNFEYLLKLDIDYIKIDGSLIRNIDQDRNARAVAETVVDFARRLKLETVAEFVHSESVRYAVEEMGVDYLQGFLLGEPEPLEQIAQSTCPEPA